MDDIPPTTTEPADVPELAPPRPLTPREDQLARNHAAVIERLQREGIPIPPPPAEPGE